jgi:hypothetical protein
VRIEHKLLRRPFVEVLVTLNRLFQLDDESSLVGVRRQACNIVTTVRYRSTTGS